MDWSDIRQHVETIYGNVHSDTEVAAGNETADSFVNDCKTSFANDGHQLDEQDAQFLAEYAEEYWNRYN